MQLEARYNQRGVAAFSAYVHHKKELIPFNRTFFGRGKLEGAEEDIFKFNEPGFAPVRDGPNLDRYASAIRKVIEWSEYISQQRLEGNFPLDYHADDKEFNHHNEVVLNYWIHIGLLQLNVQKKCSSYEWPPNQGRWVYRTHPYEYIGNPDVSGPLNLFYHGENSQECLSGPKP